MGRERKARTEGSLCVQACSRRRVLYCPAGERHPQIVSPPPTPYPSNIKLTSLRDTATTKAAIAKQPAGQTTSHHHLSNSKQPSLHDTDTTEATIRSASSQAGRRLPPLREDGMHMPGAPWPPCCTMGWVWVAVLCLMAQ